MSDQNQTLYRNVKKETSAIISNEFDKSLVYTNIELLNRILKGFEEIAQEEGLEKSAWDLCKTTLWLKFVGLKDLSKFKDLKSPFDFIEKCETTSFEEAKRILNKHEATEEQTEIVLGYFKDTHPNAEPQSKASKVLKDSLTIDVGKPKGKKKLRLLYDQFLLTDTLRKGKSSWLNFVIDYLTKHKYATYYGQTVLTKEKDKLHLKLQKELKDIAKQEQLVLKKEMSISDDELKALKKKLKSVDGRDERGIQTMFRTTSKNHYTLNQMVDRKSSIMISINSILLSILVSRLVTIGDQICIHNSPIIVMIVAALTSIIFAVLAIRPETHHGKFTIQDVRNKQGNLLFFGNYYNMNFREYNWGILEMLNDSDHLYTSMIRDQYYLGQMLAKKYKNIRWSLTVFMFGLIATILLFFFLMAFTDFHFGAGNH